MNPIMMKNFYGTGVALVTPFEDNGMIDYTALERTVEYAISGGVDYLVVMGTTAENPVLSFNEKQEVLSFVVKVANKRAPIVLGIGSNNTQCVINDMKSYCLDGVGAILSVVPYYNKPNQAGIYAHFAAISANSPLPIILYNVPGRTGANMTADTVIRLANDFENIVAVKEASGNMSQVAYILKNKPADFALISGDDNLTMPIISMGGAGVISVSANAIPNEVSECVSNALAGDFIKAREAYYKILEFQDIIFEEGNPVGIKCAMAIKGLLENNLRLPLVPSSARLEEKLRNVMQENGLL